MSTNRKTSTMKEIGKEHPVEYRREVLKPLFDCIIGAESCYLIGAGSMGKTRILDHMIRSDVQNDYLKERAAQTLICRVDMNRLSDYSEWEFYELMLFTFIQTIGNHEKDSLVKLSANLMEKFLLPVLDQSENTIRALRFLELAISNLMVEDEENSICFLLDEFDEAYRRLPAKVFAHLRGIRDTHKNRLCYALLLRNQPARLRPQMKEHESFYELFSRNVIPIRAYTSKDASAMISQLEERRNRPIEEDETREKIYLLSGGHPGLIQAIFSLLLKLSEGNSDLFDPRWLITQEVIREECRKLLESLEAEERAWLVQFTREGLNGLDPQVRQILQVKGVLIKNELKTRVFSPILHLYLQQ